MKTHFLACLSVTIVIISTSCQKDFEITPGITENILNDSVFIKKIISFDTTGQLGLDTAFLIEYFYDNQKRIVKLASIEYGLGGIQYPYTYKFYYANNDTLPNKSVSTNYSSTDSSVKYYTFNSNGFIVKDSTSFFRSGISEPLEKRLFYQLDNNIHCLKKYRYDSASNSFILRDSITYVRQIVNGNLTNAVDSGWNLSSNALIYMNKFQYSFDNKKSPFQQITYRYKYLGYYENDFVEDYNFLEVANAINYSSQETPLIFGTSGIQNIHYSYTYRDDGYPLVGRVSGDVDINKIIYTYIAL